jgi:arylsulfatase A-like enzyme
MRSPLRIGLALASLLLLAANPCSAALTPTPPNVLVILTDDHGIGDVSAYRPEGDVRTPALDRLASEGLLFTSMRANATVCSPTRAALLTGRFPDRAGVPGVIRSAPADSWGYLAPAVPTLAELLGAAGYHRAIIGKWHLGLEAPNQPNDRGFDLFHGFLGDMMDDYLTHRRHGQNLMRRNREPIAPTGHATELFTSWAIDYLRDRASDRRPFFLYLAYNAPHFPIQPPPEALARVRARAPDMDPKRALNVAFVEHLDEQIGRVLGALRDTGLERGTLVFFTSDNGGSLPHAQHNGPWRDGKQSHYDGGLRVPFLARWPGVVAPGTRSDYAGLVFDLFPTVLEATGRRVPDGTDAVSLLPILRGGSVPAGERDLYFVRREGNPAYGGLAYHALIRGEWKLLQNSPYAPLELYNLRLDPYEATNVLAANRDLARRLQTAMARHIQRGGAFPWQPPE